MRLRICTGCTGEKPAADFQLAVGQPGHNYCRVCQRQIRKDYGAKKQRIRAKRGRQR